MSLPNKCPLCNSKSANQTVVTPHVYGQEKGRGHSFFHCHACDVYYQYPRLNPDEEAQFYTKEFEKFMETRAGKSGGWQKANNHISVNEETRRRRMKYLEPYLRKKLNILEVGCSSGFMLYPLGEMGHHCVGVEPSGVFSDFVKSKNLTVHNSMEQLIENSPESKFDLIMHFFVLEHISEPLKFLSNQLNLLKPNGKIIFEIPNVADPLYSIYDIPAFERFYWSMAHPWYFSQKSLKYLLNKLGHSFEIQLDQRYDLSNHITWAKDGCPGGMGKFSELLGKELEEDYKNNLIKIGKCDTLIGIISKKGINEK